jgi:hypothetical protein
MHSTRLEHWGRGLAVGSGETVAAYWVKVLAAEAFASRSSCIVLGSSVAATRIEGVAFALASVAGSFVVA